MKKTLLFGTILFLLLSAPGVSKAQPFGAHGPANPLRGVIVGPVNGGLHFHINPFEDHSAFESLEHDSYQYYALHGYEYYNRSEKLPRLDRFKDIQYPKNEPYIQPSSDSFFGVEYDNPLKW